MLAAILSLGLLTWVGFAYIGIRARRWAWLLTALAYLFAMIFYFVAAGATADSATAAPGQTQEFNGEVATGLSLVLLWIVSTANTAIVNRDWLRWRAGK